ncbi:hypothetical protein SCLCIDRAFT_1223044 [Scleroderma citrinum Foug A]|uniref:Uncharacterized protein n=1 Tax=Scleroderma citrinum Foug A TaxID=1036808 RepID=A0A0C2YU28_9AGAM|nr:hypothetical protein SCLCIDRAFT_1223044 [Scleroderma citrinum Foug A]
MRDGGNGFNRSDAPDGLQGRPADNVYTSTFNLVCCPCGLQFDLLLEERLLSSSLTFEIRNCVLLYEHVLHR